MVDKFSVSYGNPQTVQVNARRDLGRIQLRYRVNGGRTRTASTSEWQGGKRYGDEGDYWYHRMRGQVTGTSAGDNVEVWFSAPKKHVKSDSFTYNVRSDSGARVLVLAVEDYTGNSALPPYADTTKPNYLDYYGQGAGRQRSRLRRLRLRRDGAQGPGCARSAEPLRRGHLGDRQRQRDA